MDLAERSAEKDGRAEIFEVDLAAALVEVGPALQHVGVQAAALVEVTRIREGTSSLPVASGAGPKPTAPASGVTQPSRSAAGTTYPNALPSSRPRAAELIDLAGTAQDALEKLIAVSSITQRGRTTGVVTEFVSVWEPLAPQHRDLLHQGEDALRCWVDSARAVIEAVRGDLRAFDAARATLEHVVDRKEWANPVRDGILPGPQLINSMLVLQLLLLRQAIPSAPAVDSLVVPDTNALLRWHELDRWPHDKACCLVIVPTVLTELDRHKAVHSRPEVRDKANSLVRQYKEFRSRGDITAEVTIAEKLALRSLPVTPSFQGAPGWMHEDHADDQILWSAYSLAVRYPANSVLLLTADTNMQNKAALLGISYIDPDKPDHVVSTTRGEHYHLYRANTTVVLPGLTLQEGEIRLDREEGVAPFLVSGALTLERCGA